MYMSRNRSPTMYVPLGVSCPGLPNDVGIVRTTSPLRVTVMVLVLSSATVICASPIVNDERVSPPLRP